MAQVRALSVVTNTILSIIKDGFPSALVVAPTFQVFTHEDFTKKPVSEGYSLFLYNVLVNRTARSQIDRTSPDGIRMRPSLPVDLYYLLTLWAKSCEMQQWLLGYALRRLDDMPVISSGEINFRYRVASIRGSRFYFKRRAQFLSSDSTAFYKIV